MDQTSVQGAEANNVWEPVLNPVDRTSELLFGLLMALSFVGALSVAEGGRAAVGALLTAALGCNLAWGLVDAVMFLVRTLVDRGRLLTLVHAVKNAEDAEKGRALIQQSLPKNMADLLSATEIEAVRTRVLAKKDVPTRPSLVWRDYRAALAIFVLVVLATSPVVVHFLLVHDTQNAKHLSWATSLTMLFLGGHMFGSYAGYGGLKAGLSMVTLGALLVVAIVLLGG